MYGKKMKKERNAREKIIKDITKRKTVEIVVKKSCRMVQTKIDTLPQNKIRPSDVPT